MGLELDNKLELYNDLADLLVAHDASKGIVYHDKFHEFVKERVKDLEQRAEMNAQKISLLNKLLTTWKDESCIRFQHAKSETIMQAWISFADALGIIKPSSTGLLSYNNGYTDPFGFAYTDTFPALSLELQAYRGQTTLENYFLSHFIQRQLVYCNNLLKQEKIVERDKSSRRHVDRP